MHGRRPLTRQERELQDGAGRNLPLLEVADAGHHIPPRQERDLRTTHGGVTAPRRQVLREGVPPPLHATGHHTRRVFSRRVVTRASAEVRKGKRQTSKVKTPSREAPSLSPLPFAFYLLPSARAAIR